MSFKRERFPAESCKVGRKKKKKDRKRKFDSPPSPSFSSLNTLSLFLFTTACTLLDTQVYCYGGYQSASGGVFTNMKPDHLTINVTQLSPSNLPNWQPLTPPATGTRPEPRSAFSMAALDSHRYIMLGGGHGDALNTPAIIYDRNGNTWTALAEPPFYM
ncbi:hypothetical protein BC941DRAFT_66410 [Chlamydoabsidia padenii]|nr:hypothetical protein BC941DRAFT_66410 [Chlamydoabsidia padenii]